MHGNSSIVISVVVPTYRRHALLIRLLDALAAQDLPAENFEIVVADDDASPVTKSLLESYNAKAPVEVRYFAVTATQGPAGARNCGWRAARGPIIAFTDDDCIPESSWLREALAAFTADIDALAGRVVVPLPDAPTDYERDAAGLATAEFVTANCFCRRSVLEAVGGFDERFTMAWREDSDLQFSMLEQGYRIGRAPRAVVVHPVRPARFAVSITQQRKAVFNALLYRKHPPLYLQRLARFPRLYYVAVACLLAAAISWLVGERLLGAIALLCWAAAIVWFCAHRLRGTSKHPRHIAEMIVTSALIPLLSCYWLVRGNLRYGVLRF